MTLKGPFGAALAALLLVTGAGYGRIAAQAPSGIPRTADGNRTCKASGRCRIARPTTCGFTSRAHEMPAGQSVVEGDEIPYQPWAAEKQRKNFANRATDDPLNALLHAGRAAHHVPRVSVPDLPDERSRRDHVRVVAGLSAHLHERPADDARGHRVVDGQLARAMGGRRARRGGHGPQRPHVARRGRQLPQRGAEGHERYALRDANTIDYEVTIEDPKVFTRPWKIRMPLHRQTERGRACSSTSARRRKKRRTARSSPTRARGIRPHAPAGAPFDPRASGRNCRRGCRHGATKHRPTATRPVGLVRAGRRRRELRPRKRREQEVLTPPSRGIVVDPTDGKLPYQRWARAERDRPHTAAPRLRRSDGALLRRPACRARSTCRRPCTSCSRATS